MIYHCGYDDAMMKQFLRDWVAEQKLPSVTIRGTVIDEVSQQPIPFPRVFTDDAIAQANEHGRFELTARKKASASRGIALWVEADGLASGEYLVKGNDDLHIALRRDVPFFGKVIDHEGKPVEGAEVQAKVHRALMVLGDTKPGDFRGGSHGIFQVRSDRDGRFSFQGVPDGDFRAAHGLIVEANFLRTLARTHEFDDPRWPFSIKVREVAGESLIDATFWMRAKGLENANAFSATVQAKRAQIHFDLVRNILKLKLDQMEALHFDRSDVFRCEQSTLEFPLPADRQFVVKEQPIYLDVTHPRFQGSHSEASAPTRADAAPLIRLEPGAGIAGQVFDNRGQPIADAMVQVREDSGQYLAMVFTDREAGMFRTPTTLKPGQYTVVVQSPAHAPAWRTIVAGEVLSSHQFVLEPGGYITGKVVSESGEPVAGAAVGWVQPMTPERPPSRAFELGTMTATQTDGTFRLGPLPAGEFQITALAESPRRLGKTSAKVSGTAVITVRPQ